MEMAIANHVFLPDAKLLLWIQDTLRCEWLNVVMKIITHLGDFGLLWIAATIALFFFKKTRKASVAAGLAQIITLIIVNLIIKNWVARTRPYEVIGGLELLIARAHDFSFPSGHAANAFSTVVVFIWMCDEKIGVPAFIMAILISFTRIYVGIHYPTDVLAGVVIGTFSAHTGMLLTKKYYKPVYKEIRRWLKRRAVKNHK